MLPRVPGAVSAGPCKGLPCLALQMWGIFYTVPVISSDMNITTAIQSCQDVEDEISNVLKRKFFMQVPLHWRTETSKIILKDKDKACPGLVRPFTTIEVDMCCDQSFFEQFLFIQVCRSEIIHYLYRQHWHFLVNYDYDILWLSTMTIMIILCIATSPWILSMAQRNVATDLTKKHFRDHHELAGRGQEDCLSRHRMIEILAVTATRAD